jgi:S-adenosylhomocysteine hydrolase
MSTQQTKHEAYVLREYNEVFWRQHTANKYKLKVATMAKNRINWILEEGSDANIYAVY